MITEIKTRLDGHDTEIETNQTQIAELGNRLGDHDTKIEKHRKQIAKIDDRLDDHHTEINTNRTQIVKLGDRLNGHDTEIESIRTQIAELGNRLDDHVTKIEASRKQIELLSTRIEVVEVNTAHLNVCTGTDSSDIQDELNKLRETGGIVTLLPKPYIINETISIPPFVTLEGSFRSPPSVWDKGTEFVVNIEGGNEEGDPLITLKGRNSMIKGVRIIYAKQTRDEIIPFPWTIRGESDDVCIQDVCLVNSFLGVDLATHECGRHLIKGLCGQPLKIGIRIDQSLDTGRIEDVHFWPFWGGDGPAAYNHEHGIALELLGCDWQIVHNFLAYGYGVGIKFKRSKREVNGEFQKWRTGGQFSNINLDHMKIGIDFHYASDFCVHFSNLNIAAAPGAGKHAIYGNPSTDSSTRTGKLQISGASFWGLWPSEIVKWETNGFLMISSSIFESWGRDHPAIRVNEGRAMIQYNFFNDIIGESVRIGASADRVMVTGNQLTGNPIIIDESGQGHLRFIENNHE